MTLIGQPAWAQVTPQPSAPVLLSRCDFETFSRNVYNVQIHYDLLATFTNRSSRPATLVGIITEFFDEQGNVIRRLDAAYSGRFAPGQFVDHLRFGLGEVPNPSASNRCYVARVEFADGTVWSVADHYAEVERPPSKCGVVSKDGTGFDAPWNGAMCVGARAMWDAAHANRTATAPPGG
jgi:hypothetical protein